MPNPSFVQPAAHNQARGISEDWPLKTDSAPANKSAEVLRIRKSIIMDEKGTEAITWSG